MTVPSSVAPGSCVDSRAGGPAAGSGGRRGLRRRRCRGGGVIGCRVVRAVAVSAAAVLVVGACSSGSNSAGGGSSVRPLVQATDAAESDGPAEASESAGSGDSASATADGPVSAQELSDEDLGYTVASIPEDLDETQTRVLRDFIAYDQATWKIWFGKAGPEVVDPVTTDPLRESIYSHATESAEGTHANPPVTVGISEVSVNGDATGATVTTCSDRFQVTWTDKAGNDVTNPDNQTRVGASTKMVSGDDGRWLASEENQVSTGKCRPGEDAS